MCILIHPLMDLEIKEGIQKENICIHENADKYHLNKEKAMMKRIF